jgi:hypothetical protein
MSRVIFVTNDPEVAAVVARVTRVCRTVTHVPPLWHVIERDELDDGLVVPPEVAPRYQARITPPMEPAGDEELVSLMARWTAIEQMLSDVDNPLDDVARSDLDDEQADLIDRAVDTCAVTLVGWRVKAHLLVHLVDIAADLNDPAADLAASLADDLLIGTP